MKFDSFKEWQAFSARRTSTLPSSTPSNRGQDDTISRASGIGMNPTKSSTYTSYSEQARIYLVEYDRLIVYCQGVKLKDRNVTKPQDLLGKRTFLHTPMTRLRRCFSLCVDKVQGYTEMISLNSARGAAFCADIRSMILLVFGRMFLHRKSSFHCLDSTSDTSLESIQISQRNHGRRTISIL